MGGRKRSRQRHPTTTSLEAVPDDHKQHHQMHKRRKTSSQHQPQPETMNIHTGHHSPSHVQDIATPQPQEPPQPHRTTIALQPLRTFHPFPRLPLELQIQIFSHASSTEGLHHLTDRFIGTIYVNNPNHQPLDLRFFRHRPYFLFHEPSLAASRANSVSLSSITNADKGSQRSKNVTMARRNLMGTSRLARQIAVETWVKDVKGILIKEFGNQSRIHLDLYPQGKDAIIKLLRGLVAHEDPPRMVDGASHGFIEVEEEKSDEKDGSEAVVTAGGLNVGGWKGVRRSRKTRKEIRSVRNALRKEKVIHGSEPASLPRQAIRRQASQKAA